MNIPLHVVPEDAPAGAPDLPLPAHPIRTRFSIKVFGVGGAGCNTVNHIAGQPCEGVEFLCLNTDAAALSNSKAPTNLVLGAALTRGLGAGGDPEVGRVAAEHDLPQLREFCKNTDVVFVVAGMGGGTGTGAGPVVARVAQESGALVLAMVMLPFDWEGTRRQEQAARGLQAIRHAADGVICLPNQKLFSQMDEKTSVLEMFTTTHELVAQGIRGIWRLLGRPGLINVDFADLCAVTRECHGESSMATALGQGDQRAREAVEKLLGHPLLDQGAVLNDAAAALVSLVGGPDLTMFEVNKVMTEIRRHCAEDTHIIVGAAIEESHAGKLAITLVTSRKSLAALPSPPQDGGAVGELADHSMDLTTRDRASSRCTDPPPEPTPELIQTHAARKGRKAARMAQGQFELEAISKGRFENSEPTIHSGQDLDVPTYIRRGIALN